MPACHALLPAHPAPAMTQRPRVKNPSHTALAARDSYADAWKNFTTRLSGSLGGKYTREH